MLLSLQLMLRAGLHEADVDAEVQALVAQAEGVRESDEGVASVLLAAAQVQLPALTASHKPRLAISSHSFGLWQLQAVGSWNRIVCGI